MMELVFVFVTVRFVGITEFSPGKWVGVELEEGQVGGKNNGVVNGNEYFKCTGNRGLFVRSTQLQVSNATSGIEKWC